MKIVWFKRKKEKEKKIEKWESLDIYPTGKTTIRKA